jgi:putative toxin-antitoxin system antitoxin component (TIGR02293 family)
MAKRKTMTTLHIKNLPFPVTAEDLRKIFAAHGDVEAVRVEVDEHGQPIAFVEMSDEHGGSAQQFWDALSFRRKFFRGKQEGRDANVLMIQVWRPKGPGELPDWYVTTCKLLGKSAKLRTSEYSVIGVHDVVSKGLPCKALSHMLLSLKTLEEKDVLEAVGISSRTIQRGKRDPSKPLAPDQSGRTWRFAQLLARAKEVFGDQEQAERWFETPAVALSQRRPIDLLSSPVGADLVEQILGRLEYGVYT